MPQSSRFRAWQRLWNARLSEYGRTILRLMPERGIDESTLLIGFAIAIGATVGLAIIVFYWLINSIQRIALSAADGLPLSSTLSIAGVVLIGLVIARALVYYGANDSDGENIPDVMRAVVKRRGVIHTGPALAKTAAAAVLIGTAGSVGGEGPAAVAGAALGSRLGRFFRSGVPRLRVLVACGAAAGISAAFNAPIAGVFFALEKVVGTFGASAFPPILVSSVVAATISRGAFGNTPVIDIPHEYGIGSASELLLYALLGVITGLVAVVYTKAVYRAADFMAPRKLWSQALLAAIVVGGLNIIFRADLWGRGHETLDLAIIGARDWYFLIALAFAKLAATSVTTAAARCGGMFTPALFIGATLGGGVAAAMRQWFGLDIVPEAFALVGMAGLVAGSTHAPLTAIMIVFEMTSDYELILPIMLCGAIAYITAKRLHPESVYSEWLVRKGEHISYGKDEATLERLKVGQFYNRNPHVIGETATIPLLIKAIGQSTQTEFPVIDADLKFVGMLTYNDIRTVVADAESLGPVVMAGDLATDVFESVGPGDSLRTALQRLGVRGSHYLPVTEPGDDEDTIRLLGLISQQEIFAAYDRSLLTDDGGN